MYEPTINYLAVLIATVTHFTLGGLWYSPALFLNQWLDGMGKTKEDVNNKKVGGHGIGLLYQFLGTFVLVFITAHMVDFMKVVYHDLPNLTVGLTSAFWLWLGYIFTFGITGVVFEKHSWKLFSINMGYQFLGLMVVGAILAVWV
ncbi:MAG: DUF1761 domain-containing protein [Candidatus Marinimicrobia bacterium]|nr:DUF1761 domain-containing protein [Candidatus Neomarinimicrobiota bacterium]